MNALPPVARLDLTDLFLKQVRIQPDAPAVCDARQVVTYRELEARVQRWHTLLAQRGLQRGQRLALWSENRNEYLELQLAAARMGLIVACLNWRLQGDEQLHCIRLVRPALVVVSDRYRPALQALPLEDVPVLALDGAKEELQGLPPTPPQGTAIDPESGFLILYTSGTTGLPKGALVSQRAMVARAQAFIAEYGLRREDGFIAWSPFFHMAATDHALATLLLGAQVHVQDGFSAPEICRTLEEARIGWLLAMPGVIEPLIAELRSRPHALQGVRMVGAMADLVPRQQVAELTTLLQAPYLNTFGSTETGLAPASGHLLPVGEPPATLAKREFGWCRIRLVDLDGRDVPDGTPGHMLVRGPSVFSGYWEGDGYDASELADGWFHMGDTFVRRLDGSLDFVDRSKYLIKTGGENVYPAEIERVLLSHPDVAEVAVVRRPDARWGEVPVAFVALKEGEPSAEALQAWCRERLAGYKVPREVRFLEAAAFPRNSTGKIQKNQIEALLAR
ncbi:class I adenylate-forming enzyme family protein [Ramlibacter tataouinensis]|uniref:class I adenylate-forming enzyme family protein n=1 Tax=Ramlibacter tataouinensis TaxID=94132 RepID=UPI0022F3B023|nr:class I adenylate-forming enzyme family protein [Ramlibacter tataouinensis]WBY03581.1 class I adenylate-forming enzyme family protein [Ramlibacter tataouinensis]